MNKRKTIYLRPWWVAVFRGQRFAFEAPFTLEDCLAILHENRLSNIKGISPTRRSKGELLAIMIQIQYRQTDANRATFVAHRNHKAAVKGELLKQPDGSTLVKCWAGLGTPTAIFLWAMLIFWFWVLVAGTGWYWQSFVLFLFPLFVTSLLHVDAFWQSHLLANITYDLLFIGDSNQLVKLRWRKQQS